MDRRITGFREDDEGHWIAELDCGHARHVRHQPPFAERAWVLTEAGRAEHLGERLNCGTCAEKNGGG